MTHSCLTSEKNEVLETQSRFPNSNSLFHNSEFNIKQIQLKSQCTDDGCFSSTSNYHSIRHCCLGQGKHRVCIQKGLFSVPLQNTLQARTTLAAFLTCQIDLKYITKAQEKWLKENMPNVKWMLDNELCFSCFIIFYSCKFFSSENLLHLFFPSQFVI